jgi:hypothetical protein
MRGYKRSFDFMNNRSKSSLVLFSKDRNQVCAKSPPHEEWSFRTTKKEQEISHGEFQFANNTKMLIVNEQHSTLRWFVSYSMV